MSDALTADHPAKWSDTVLVAMHDAVKAEAERVGKALLILDPFAGVGRERLAQAIQPHAAGVDGVEMQPEWVARQRFDHDLIPGEGVTLLGDATHLPSTWTGLYDAVCTSPVFGNRMSDSHQAKDPCKACVPPGSGRSGHDSLDPPCRTCGGTGLSKRYTYAHYLRAAGGDIVPGSAAAMQWGREYRLLHRDALREMIRVVVPGGLLAINMSNHFRTLAKGQPAVEQDVVGWWVNQIIVAGCMLRGVVPVRTPRSRVGANAHPEKDTETGEIVGPDPRAECEYLITAHTPTPRRLL